jgi:hypothetical protein
MPNQYETPGERVPRIPDPAGDNPDGGPHLPTMPDPANDPERSQRFPTDPDPAQKPSPVNDPLPGRDNEGDDSDIEQIA